MSGLGHPARWNVYGERQVDEAGDGGGLGPVRIPLQFVVEQFGGRYGQRAVFALGSARAAVVKIQSTAGCLVLQP